MIKITNPRELIPTFSYIIGVIEGDGTVYHSNTNYVVRLSVTDKEFADSFNKALESIAPRFRGLNPYRRIYKPQKENYKKQFVVQASSKEFYEWYTSQNGFEKIVKKFPAPFLRGFYESDGHESIEECVLCIGNTDKGLIRLAEIAVRKLGFKYSINKEEYGENKICYRLFILGGAKRRNKFLEEINPCIRNKKWCCRSFWTEKEEEKLRREYNEKTTKQIARELDRPFGSVLVKAHKLGLSKRKSWTKEEEEKLRGEYQKKTAEQLSEEMKRSKQSIYSKAHKLDLAKEREWSKREIEKLKREYPHKTAEELTREMKRTIPAIRNKLSQLGITKVIRHGKT